MSAYIIDTNVIATANGYADHLNQESQDKCNDFLLDLYKNKMLISIDNLNLIFDEYFKYANRSGKPNFGDTFVSWIYENQYNTDICELVEITPLKNNTDFKEIPRNSGLEKFDPSDKKFIAVSLGSKLKPEICNAADSDWFNFKKEIENLGIKLKFIL